MLTVKHTSIVVVGDYCEDNYIFAQNLRRHNLSEPETPIGKYHFESVRVPTLVPALAQYIAEREPVHVYYDKTKPYGKYARSTCWVSPQNQNGKSIWCINRDFQLVPGHDKYPVIEFERPEPTSSYQVLTTTSHTPVFCMDCDKGWRLEYWDKFADLIKTRQYIIRCHDPRRSEWKKFRERLHKQPARPGIWLCHSVDIANGALRAPGIWDDHRRIICGWLRQDHTLWNGGWLHHIVVKIDQDGILILGPRSGEGGIMFTSAGDQPGSFIRKHPHHVVGNGLAFFASFVPAVTQTRTDKDMGNELVKCAQQGLAQCRHVTAQGYNHPQECNHWRDFCKITEILPKIKTPDTAFLIDYDAHDNRTSFDKACEIVYQEHSRFLKSVMFTLGNLATAEKKFALSLLTLESRLKTHRDSGTGVTSFAVFGEPGSGKSFVAEELIQSLDPEDNFFERITFNLSQFGGHRDRLIAAFQKIEGVSKSKIPFVLWDEFDTAIDGKACGWLPEFLMPMQDAKFFDGTRVGKLAKCIFAFMGGIYHNHEDFLKWTVGQGKQLKGPDFHSRLQSSLPLPSVKLKPCRNSFTSNDTAKLTRAILIRIYLREHNSIRLISKDVLAFLLHVPLQHGARSLKQIIKASALRDTEVYSRWHLPSIDVLRLHIQDLKKDFGDQRKGSVRREESVDLVARYVEHDLKAPQLIGKKFLPLLWRSYRPSINKKLAIDLTNVKEIFGEDHARINERVIALAKKLASETHKAWDDKRHTTPPPTEDSPFFYVNEYDKRDGDYSKLPELEKEQYFSAAMEAIREEMKWRNEKKE